MDTNTLKHKLPGLILDLEKIIPYAAALHKRSAGVRVVVNRVQESIEPEDPSEGLVVTVWNGQSFFEHATNNLDWTTLKESSLTLARAAQQAVDPSRPRADIDPGLAIQTDFIGPDAGAADKLTLSQKLEMAQANLQTALAKDTAVANAFSWMGDRTNSDLFVNRAKVMSQTIARTESGMVVFVSDGARTTEIHDGVSKNGGYDKTTLPTDRIQRLVEDGKHLLGASRLVPGVYDVVVDSDWAGIIAHECFGHGMETDLYVRDRALSRRYIGKTVASPLVNMMDDPSLIEEAGGFFFDDEGHPATATRIIKEGELERGLTDLASAHRLQLPRSANGRRESFERKAYARMTNTFFDNGASTQADMIASIKKGLYLRYATNGMEDPQAWGIQVEGLWAEEILDGRLTGRVYSPVIMTGFVPDLLQSISMVGNDRWISGLGICGKGHKEWVKNTTGGPHLKLKARLA